MLPERRLYVGPSLRRLRRDHGLTQADMAADLDVSASYIALLERNHRPLSAEMLLRLSQTYKMDMAALAGDGGSDDAARLHRRDAHMARTGVGGAGDVCELLGVHQRRRPFLSSLM